MSSPIDPIRILGEQVAKLAASLGLELHTFAVLPSFTGGPDTVQAMFVFDDQAATKVTQAASDPEQAQFDAAFEAMMREQKKNEESDKFKAAEEAAKKMAEDLAKGQLHRPDDETE